MTEIVADIIKPFGPSIFKVKIPKQIVDDLNQYVDNIVENETKSNQLNYGNQLIGDVTQEFKLEEDFIKQIGWLGFLGNCTSNWIQNVTGNKIKNFSIMDSWIVRQFENARKERPCMSKFLTDFGFRVECLGRGFRGWKRARETFSGRLGLSFEG